MITRCPIYCSGFEKSSNYIDMNGNHPAILSCVVYNKVFVNKDISELKENEWLYIGKETKEQIEFQLSELKFHKDFIAIFKE